jgi:hypothetical protein
MPMLTHRLNQAIGSGPTDESGESSTLNKKHYGSSGARKHGKYMSILMFIYQKLTCIVAAHDKTLLAPFINLDAQRPATSLAPSCEPCHASDVQIEDASLLSSSTIYSLLSFNIVCHDERYF